MLSTTQADVKLCQYLIAWMTRVILKSVFIGCHLRADLLTVWAQVD